MALGLVAYEVMDKEPPLWLISLCSFSIGAIGMLLARRRPLFCAPFIVVVLLGAFPLYSELTDPFVGPAILKEGGVAYVGRCGIAILSGIGMPILGAFLGTKKLDQTIVAWRWASGISGAVLLGLTLFVGYGFVEAAYYDYILFPIQKAREGYIMPLRWQDIVAEVSIACVLIGLLVLSTYLLLSAVQRQKNNKIAASPD
jgi:hypothetical protein